MTGLMAQQKCRPEEYQRDVHARSPLQLHPTQETSLPSKVHRARQLQQRQSIQDTAQKLLTVFQ
jgi:hypothetical protein